jgi:hypothetical protein
MPPFEEAITGLQNKEAVDFYIHERVLCKELHISPTDGDSIREQLSKAIRLIKKGRYGINGVGQMADLSDTNNTTFGKAGVHFITYGAKELFTTNKLSSMNWTSAMPRCFAFGRTKFQVSVQVKICRHLQKHKDFESWFTDELHWRRRD